MKKIALILLVCCVAVACGGKKEVKQVSPESKTATEAFVLAETIKTAFVGKDATTLQKNSTDTGLRDITANTKTFDSVDLSFTPRWVEIEGSKLMVNIAWKSTWLRSGRRSDERGMAIFVMEGTPLRVSKILRANPFVFPKGRLQWGGIAAYLQATAIAPVINPYLWPDVLLQAIPSTIREPVR